MKPIFTFTIIAGAFCSCNTYQYITLSSPDLHKNYRHQFVMENDTMKLLYDFNGLYGPLKITVYNKLDKPLMIDLNRSALIINDEAIGLNDGNLQVSSSVSVNSVGGNAVASGSADASAMLPNSSAFLPSGTYVTRSTVIVTNHLLAYPQTDSHGKTPGTVHFDRKVSPLFFKTYLTFVHPDSEKKETTMLHNFYASKVTLTKHKPAKTGYYQRAAGDEFYVSRINKGVNSTAGIVLLLVTVVATTLLWTIH